MNNENLPPINFGNQPSGAEFGPLPMPGQEDKNHIEITDLGPAPQNNGESKTNPKTRERNLGSAALAAEIEKLKDAERQLYRGESEEEFTNTVMSSRRTSNSLSDQPEQGKAA